MRINIVQTIIALAVSILIAYGFYSFQNSENKILFSVGSFVFLTITLVMTIGVRFRQIRTTTNIKVVSFIFFIIGLISNIVFSYIMFSVPVYLITFGILLLLFALITYSINRVNL
jgi:hypothetical protein